MAKKNNIRSIRFSDEIIEMIESQTGDTFTAKFEALVTRCMWELPKKEQELKSIQERIDYQRKQLSRISQKVNELERCMNNARYTMENYDRTMKQAVKNLEQMCNTD